MTVFTTLAPGSGNLLIDPSHRQFAEPASPGFVEPIRRWSDSLQEVGDAHDQHGWLTVALNQRTLTVFRLDPARHVVNMDAFPRNAAHCR